MVAQPLRSSGPCVNSMCRVVRVLVKVVQYV